MLEIKLNFKDNESKMRVMESIHQCLAGDKAYAKNSVVLNCDEDNTGYLQVCTYNMKTSQMVLDLTEATIVEDAVCEEN